MEKAKTKKKAYYNPPKKSLSGQGKKNCFGVNTQLVNKFTLK